MRHCEDQVRRIGLPLDEGLSVAEICEHIGDQRQRRIHVITVALPAAGPDGLWVATDRNDFIFVEERLVPVHQQQVVLHEIGHIVCDHAASPALTDQDSRLLLPSLDPDAVRRILGREHGDSEAEMEAELVGSLIGKLISLWSVRQPREVPPEARQIATRLTALESRVPGRT